MSNYVRISTVAPRRLREKPERDQAAVDRMIAFWREELNQVLPDQPDLILLPEVCDSYAGPSIAALLPYYQLRGDQVLRFFADTAREHNCYIAYSAVRELSDGTWRNSTQLIGRDGAIVGIYNKKHCPINETSAGILCGREAPVFTCDFGRVGCAICFDLTFEALRLEYTKSRPDLILFSSLYHGGLMQSYWAYTCRAHLVTSISGVISGVLSPVGNVLATTTNYFDFVTATVNLDCKVVHLDYNWEKLHAMREKYGPIVSVYDPGHLGAVLVTSETDVVTSDDLIREFELELWDDYYARTLSNCLDPKNMEPA